MRTILLLSLLLLVSCAPYRVRHDLAYGTGARQTYDYYEPRVDVAGSPRPVLLVVHGGGYVSGDKAWAEAVAERFCPAGYVVVAINYTLADGIPGSTWPAQLRDAQVALEYVRTAGWMRVRRPVVGFGVSAGAHLVAALHLQGDLPRAVLASGPWDFVNASSAQLDGTLRALLGLWSTSPIPPQDRAALSPVNWAHPSGDVLLIHARRDPLTVYQHATSFRAALVAAGARVELVTINSSSHGSAWKDAVLRTLGWLK